MPLKNLLENHLFLNFLTGSFIFENMKELIPKSTLTFPKDKEIRITYPKDSKILVGQVADMVLSLSGIFFFLAVVSEFITWKLTFLLIIISAISGVLKYKFPSNSLKEIVLKPDSFKYNYHISMNNRAKTVSAPLFIDFHVRFKENAVNIKFMEISINLFDANDLSLFVDKIAEMFGLEYYDTCRLSNQREVLMYQSKKRKRFNYLTLINIVFTNPIKIYDMNNQGTWIEINENSRTIRYIDTELIQPYLSIDISTIQAIEIIMYAGKWVRRGRNKIVIKIKISQKETVTVFETMTRQQRQELTTFRDTDRIYQQLQRIQCLQGIGITKKYILY